LFNILTTTLKRVNYINVVTYVGKLVLSPKSFTKKYIGVFPWNLVIFRYIYVTLKFNNSIIQLDGAIRGVSSSACRC